MKTGATRQVLEDKRGILGCTARPKYLPYTSYRSGLDAVTLKQAGFASQTSPSGASQANSNTKGLCDTEAWPTDAQQELQHQIDSSFDISAKVFLQPLSIISPKLPYWQPKHKSSPTIYPSLTLTSTCYLKCC